MTLCLDSVEVVSVSDFSCVGVTKDLSSSAFSGDSLVDELVTSVAFSSLCCFQPVGSEVGESVQLPDT